MAVTIGTCVYIISELLFDDDDMTYGTEEEDGPYENMIPFVYVMLSGPKPCFFAIARDIDVTTLVTPAESRFTRVGLLGSYSCPSAFLVSIGLGFRIRPKTGLTFDPY